ncbi:MAG: GNAT family N-acetyltransferase, partial [Vicinamibacterales bacterium]
MIHPAPITLAGDGVVLEPLAASHAPALAAAAADGELWRLWYTSVPEPAGARADVDAAREGQAAGHMLAWAGRESGSGAGVGTSRYHDIVAAI